jgi:hypothetical protein
MIVNGVNQILWNTVPECRVLINRLDALLNEDKNTFTEAKEQFIHNLAEATNYVATIKSNKWYYDPDEEAEIIVRRLNWHADKLEHDIRTKEGSRPPVLKNWKKRHFLYELCKRLNTYAEFEGFPGRPKGSRDNKPRRSMNGELLHSHIQPSATLEQFI